MDKVKNIELITKNKIYFCRKQGVCSDRQCHREIRGRADKTYRRNERELVRLCQHAGTRSAAKKTSGRTGRKNGTLGLSARAG